MNVPKNEHIGLSNADLLAGMDPFDTDFVKPQKRSEGRRAARAPAGRRLRKGFSLIEVIMATVVMTFGLGTAIVGLQIGMRDLDLARATTAVSQALQNEAERLRMMKWSDIEALSSTETISQASTFSAEPILKGRLTMSRIISDVSGQANMKEIVLKAVWKGMDGKSHTRIYRMRYGKGGLHDYYYSSAGS
jgi:prepilin-type N-terminal cleavage/methylation domain-containing protein